MASRRDEIRGAALELFATKGYRATTMADIGDQVGIRGPSIYKHVPSKHDLLIEIMLTTMERLLEAQKVALASTDDAREQLRHMAEAHARYHVRHRDEAFVGTREIENLEEPHRGALVKRRSTYERGFRKLIQTGKTRGLFDVESPRLASYAILDMGMGIPVWFRPDGPLEEDEIVAAHGDFALKMVGARRRSMTKH